MFLTDWYLRKALQCARRASEATSAVERAKYLEDEKLWHSLARAEAMAENQVELASFSESNDELRALLVQPHIILPAYSDDPATQRRAARYINPPAMRFANGSNNFTLVGDEAR